MSSEAQTTIATDPEYRHAVEIVLATGKTGVAHLQAKLSVGYNRAARLLEAMELDKIVGPYKADGTREFLAVSVVGLNATAPVSMSDGNLDHIPLPADVGTCTQEETPLAHGKEQTANVAVNTILEAIAEQLLESAAPYDQACSELRAELSAGGAVKVESIAGILARLDQSAVPFELAREGLRVLLEVIEEAERRDPAETGT